VTEHAPAPAETPVGESRLQRGRRLTRRTILYLAVTTFLLASIYIILLIVQNTKHVKVSYVFGTANAALLWIVIVSAIAGWVLGIATSVLIRRRTRRP
jgi:uncharacterized integral membrane protein